MLPPPFLLRFFRFMHVNVSADFSSIRVLPYICVYRNPCSSFACAKPRSIVSLRWGYHSFTSQVYRFFSPRAAYSAHTCRVTVLMCVLLAVHPSDADNARIPSGRCNTLCARPDSWCGSAKPHFQGRDCSRTAHHTQIHNWGRSRLWSAVRGKCSEALCPVN